jgi:hypothetical protein
MLAVPMKARVTVRISFGIKTEANFKNCGMNDLNLAIPYKKIAN